jgi:hypothetical protein
LIIGVKIQVGKTAACFITGSAAILSHFAASVVRVVAGAFAAFSLRLSRKPAAPNFLYGYERITFFSAGFAGAMIILAVILEADGKPVLTASALGWWPAWAWLCLPNGSRSIRRSRSPGTFFGQEMVGMALSRWPARLLGPGNGKAHPRKAQCDLRLSSMSTTTA